VASQKSLLVSEIPVSEREPVAFNLLGSPQKKGQFEFALEIKFMAF
jgi:hypothetical protein